MTPLTHLEEREQTHCTHECAHTHTHTHTHARTHTHTHTRAHTHARTHTHTHARTHTHTHTHTVQTQIHNELVANLHSHNRQSSNLRITVQQQDQLSCLFHCQITKAMKAHCKPLTATPPSPHTTYASSPHNLFLSHYFSLGVFEG